MNILFITEDHSIRNYGITSVVSQFADQLTAYENIKVTILAVGDKAVHQKAQVKIIQVPPSRFGKAWGWSPLLINTIKQTIFEEKISVVHIHGVWMAAQWSALKVARDYGIPCMISPHGMLEDWLWNKQKFLQKLKKKVYFNLLIRPALSSQTIFHAITPIELESLNHQLPIYRKVTIPNAIDLPREKTPQEDVKPEKQFLFLGRIHPVKGVENLIDAFIQANLGSAWRLLIAGPEYVDEYVKKLKDKVISSGMLNRIIFTGPVYGEQKNEMLQKSWALVIPSYSEVMGMVNLEAAALHLPSITTHETGLWDWEVGGGMLIHPAVTQISDSLQQSARWTLTERLERGKRSFDLVSEKYSWQAVIPKWLDFYYSLDK